MSLLVSFLYGCIIVLGGVAFVLLSYLFYLRINLKKIACTTMHAPTDNASLKKNLPLFVPYSEYKKRHGVRLRDIAILACNRNKLTQQAISDFIDTMREHGSLIYHFSAFYGNNNIKLTKKLMSNILHGSYQMVYTVGQNATNAALEFTGDTHRDIPLVFGNVETRWWQNKSNQSTLENATGVTTTQDWKQRLGIFFKIKPTMQGVLMFRGSNYTDATIASIKKVFESNNVTVYDLAPQSAIDLLQSLPRYLGKIDAIFTLDDPVSSGISNNIAHYCTEHEISYFSLCLDDIDHGASVAVGPENMPIGRIAANHALDILENDKKASDLGIKTIEANYPLNAAFNQTLMKKQGLNPDRITDIALEVGVMAKVHFEEAYDREDNETEEERNE